MKVGVSRYIVDMTRDDHFVTGARSSGGRVEIDIIIYIKLFSWNLNRFNGKYISCNSSKYISDKIFSWTKQVL